MEDFTGKGICVLPELWFQRSVLPVFKNKLNFLSLKGEVQNLNTELRIVPQTVPCFNENLSACVFLHYTSASLATVNSQQAAATFPSKTVLSTPHHSASETKHFNLIEYLC